MAAKKPSSRSIVNRDRVKKNFAIHGERKTIGLELLENEGGGVTLIANDGDSGKYWILMIFAPDEVSLCSQVPGDIGLPVDSSGRIVFDVQD